MTTGPTTAAPTTPGTSPTIVTPTTPGTSPGTAACRISYAITSQWTGGFQGDVTITNTGATAVNGWTLRWTFPNGQQIAQAWNASYAQSGTQVTATNASWNGAIAPSGTASFGFTASWTGTNAKPTGFTLNNATCAVA